MAAPFLTPYMINTFYYELPFSTKKEINDWAKRYTKNQTGVQRLVERYLIDLKDTVEERKTHETPNGYLCYDELYDLVYWKLKRSRWIGKNTAPCVKKITGEAFRLDDDWKKLEKLTALKGVRESVASAILHLCDRGNYPILDKHVLRSIKIDYKEVIYDAEFWKKYVGFCRAKAKHYGVSMRTLDQALWKYSEVGIRENAELRQRCYPPGGGLGVTINEEKQIRHAIGADTFVETIEKMGVERVASLGIECRRFPLISDIDWPGIQQRKSGDYYIITDSNSHTKKSILEKIAYQFDVDLIVDWME